MILACSALPESISSSASSMAGCMVAVSDSQSSRIPVRIRERLSNSQLYFVDILSGQVVQIHNVAFKLQGPGETIQIQVPKHPKFVRPFGFDFEL